MELLTLLLAVVVSLIAIVWFRRPDPRLPPSPLRPLPLLGHLLYMESDFRPLFKKWRKQNGDIYSLYMGRYLVVVLNGYDLIKEALFKKGDAISDRPPYFMGEVVGMGNEGIVLGSGNNWKEQRSVTISILRAFGMGKDLLAQKIQEEVGFYLKYLSSLQGNPTDIRVQTNISICNIICSILIGHRFDYDDKDLQELMKKLCSIVTDQQSVSLINFFPWLQYIPGDLFGAQKIAANMKAILEMLNKFLNEKKQSLKDDSQASNLIDAYLVERNKKIKSGTPTFLDDKNLLTVVFDLFAAGTETTSTTIYWCVLYMMYNPGIQEKVFREIKQNAGTDRTPTIQDKVHLIYLNAVIMETQRLASIAPLSMTHMCSEEVTLRDYTIPKGTWFIPNLDSVLHDKTTWGDDTMTFRPERFIDDEGRLKNPEQFIPFGIGRRICPGEGIAKMELFLFLSSMLQRFKILPPSPDHAHKLDYDCGLIIAPKPYKVRIVERI